MEETQEYTMDAHDWAEEVNMRAYTDIVCDAIASAISEAIDDADVPKEHREKVASILNNNFNDWF